MLTDDQLDQLRYKGEGSDLDYKADRYPFASATDDAKSELLKDILAMANAHRDGTAYILIGFKESSPHPAEVVGVLAEGAIDDSRIQQFVNEKLESKLDFRYEERIFDGKHVAVIAIPKQSRPFYLKKSYGKLPKDTVYIRRGSSTAVASPREVAMMGAGNAIRPPAKIDLELMGHGNLPLVENFQLAFYCSSSPYPDFSTEERSYDPFDRTSIYIKTHEDNRHFWREAAEHLFLRSRLVTVRMKVTNRSEFALNGAKLEVWALGPSDMAVDLNLVDELPEMPTPRWNIMTRRMRHMVPVARHGSRAPQMEVDTKEGHHVCRVRLGSLLPGESVFGDEALAVLPELPGPHLLKVRILAQELNPPLSFEHIFEVQGKSEALDLDGLKSLIYQSINGTRAD
ncbi:MULTISPECIES: AlbA family DNA-binding domain-containing protein [Stenotrophomonas]|jgi:hypothetical protein|uniref:AlbA family DNA-binding domain-containing protein n=1 Tax=Stenotrophomonas TaxID=40323 RepID=UPI0008DC6764|nr:ATP-binding protein [Stenotrophomonas maltophilia]MBN5162625.1 ATP-binding protein [Stenotrophomonas maltophilia]OHY71379.1 hypothetical protein BB780_05800 [Stenotrophomonas maltophilia]HEL4843872.1 ATP-binding protein [Stenotrophomonas maltophilia]